MLWGMEMMASDRAMNGDDSSMVVEAICLLLVFLWGFVVLVRRGDS